MNQDELYEKALGLLDEVHDFHISRVAVMKVLDKKSKNSYNELMVKIFNFVKEEGNNGLGQ